MQKGDLGNTTKYWYVEVIIKLGWFKVISVFSRYVNETFLAKIGSIQKFVILICLQLFAGRQITILMHDPKK
jgi:hypothetical protein